MEPTETAPAWEKFAEQVVCPLCGYNLFGLAEPRCPECGFRFTWSELLDKDRHHPYLFEDHPRRNLWSFWSTYRRDWRADKFWTGLSPTLPIRFARLVFYAALTVLFAALIQLIPRAISMFRIAFGDLWPVDPYHRHFYHDSLVLTQEFWQDFWHETVTQGHVQSQPIAAGVWLLWWVLTLLTLQIFQTSMLKAKVNFRHVLRAVVYGTDYGLLFTLLVWLVTDIDDDFTFQYLVLGVCCLIVVTWRLGRAYKHYLRFDHPFLTVLASQVIALMVLCIALMALPLRFF